MTKIQRHDKGGSLLRAVFAALAAVCILAAPLNLDAAEKAPPRKPYSDLKLVTPEEDLEKIGLSTSYETVVLGGRLLLIGGDERQGVLATPDLGQWTEASADTELELVGHAAVAFKGRIWVIGGSGPDGFTNDVWSSPDGKTWSKAKTPPFAPRADHAAVAFQDKLWVLGGSGEELESFSDIWCSADGENWDLITAKAGFGRRDHHAAVAFDGKLWVIGGNLYDSSDDFSPQAWSSPNGKDWSLTKKDIGCRPLDGMLKAAVHGNRIWLAAWGPEGITLWHSFKGVFWLDLKPKTEIDDECASLADFRGRLYVFTPQGIFALD